MSDGGASDGGSPARHCPRCLCAWWRISRFLNRIDLGREAGPLHKPICKVPQTFAALGRSDEGIVALSAVHNCELRRKCSPPDSREQLAAVGGCHLPRFLDAFD